MNPPNQSFWTAYGAIVGTLALCMTVGNFLWDRHKWKKTRAVDLMCTSLKGMKMGRRLNQTSFTQAQADELDCLYVKITNVGAKKAHLTSLFIYYFKKHPRSVKTRPLFKHLLNTEGALPATLAEGDFKEFILVQDKNTTKELSKHQAYIAIFDAANPSFPLLLSCVSDGKKMTEEAFKELTSRRTE